MSSITQWWCDFGSTILFMILGVAISFYATIVFERYKRFGEVLRELVLARVPFEGYPISPRDLSRAHMKAIEYWRFLETKKRVLDSEGHQKVAAKVGRLESFAYRTTACIERMLKDQNNNKPIDLYLGAFQSEYKQIKNKEFVRFEETHRPNWKSLLQPFPQSILPTKREHILVDYFDKLL